MPAPAKVIEIDSIVTRFGEQVVHDGVSFDVERGTLVALIGGSGSGKSVLLREVIGLQRPTSGRIRLLGTDVWNASADEMNATRRRFGMMFQDGALFSSLTVAENIAVPLTEHAQVPEDILDALVSLRLSQAGLGPDAAPKMPSELSGGMRKRAANSSTSARVTPGSRFRGSGVDSSPSFTRNTLPLVPSVKKPSGSVRTAVAPGHFCSASILAN